MLNPQLIHMVCHKWWSYGPTWTHYFYFTIHSLPCEQVVANVIVLLFSSSIAVLWALTILWVGPTHGSNHRAHSYVIARSIVLKQPMNLPLPLNTMLHVNQCHCLKCLIMTLFCRLNETIQNRQNYIFGPYILVQFPFWSLYFCNK